MPQSLESKELDLDYLSKFDRYANRMTSIWSRYERAVGKFIFSFNRLESALKSILMRDTFFWSGDDPTDFKENPDHVRLCQILSAELSLLQIVDVIGAEAKNHLNKDELEYLEFIFSKIRSVNSYRNDLVHGEWVAKNPENNFRVIGKRRIKIRGSRGLRIIEDFPHIGEILKKNKECFCLTFCVCVLSTQIRYSKTGILWDGLGQNHIELRELYGNEIPEVVKRMEGRQT